MPGFRVDAGRGHNHTENGHRGKASDEKKSLKGLASPPPKIGEQVFSQSTRVERVYTEKNRHSESVQEWRCRRDMAGKTGPRLTQLIS